MSFIDSSQMFYDLNAVMVEQELDRELRVHYKASYERVNVFYCQFEQPSTIKKLIFKLVKKPLEINKNRYVVEIFVREDYYIADVLTVDKLEDFISRVISVRNYELQINQI